MRAGTLAIYVLVAMAGCGRFHFGLTGDGDANGDGVGDGDGGIDAPTGPPSTFGKITSFAVGDDQGCAVRDDGTLWCWGGAFYGQNLLGADYSPHPFPTLITGLPRPASAVYAGGQHTCVVLDDGTLWCAGGDILSTFTATYPAGWSKTLQQITGFTAAVTQVSIGSSHICAVTSDQKLWCWGFGLNGRLGNGSTGNELSPKLVSGITGVTSVAAGSQHTCALTALFQVYCWGGNASGQVGNGGGADVLSPTLIAGALQVVAGQAFTCILLSTGGVTCWGDNSNGALGDNTKTSHPSPTPSLVNDATAIMAGRAHTCAIRAGALAWCWGLDRPGQLGDGITFDEPAAVQVQKLGTVALLGSSSSSNSTCARTMTNELWCWGENDYGLVGDGHASFEPYAAAASFANVAEAAPGFDHMCLRSTTGIVTCIGENYDGQLGNSSTQVSSTEVSPMGIATATTIAAGIDHSGAVRTGADLVMFGGNGYAQLGDGSTMYRTTPTSIGLAGIVEISADSDHTCARTASKTLYCWGTNNLGQVGDNSTMLRTTPVQVTTLGTTVEDACVGGQSSCALTTSGSVECWGSNSQNAVGDNTGNDRKVPTAVLGLPTSAVQVACGDATNCARLSDGDVYCWGYDENGEHGDGTSGGANAASKTMLPATATQIAFGSSTGCAVLADTRVFCWGSGGDGLLGNGDGTFSPMPREVTGLTGATRLFMGPSSACAARTDGSLWCWGYNGFGQLGRGYTGHALVPVQPWLPAP